MSWLPEIADPYVAALAGGFVYGLFFCTSTCLPFIASYIAGINADFRRGVGVTLIFNSGRITAYALVGAAIGLLGLVVDNPLRTTFQTYTSYAFSIVTIAIGVVLLLKKKTYSCNCAGGANKMASSEGFRKHFDLSAYALGLSRGLILCPPLLAIVLAYSVAFASPVGSIAMAVLFGLGTSLSPILLLGGATGWLLSKAPLFRTWISRCGAAALIVLGLVTFANAIHI